MKIVGGRMWSLEWADYDDSNIIAVSTDPGLLKQVGATNEHGSRKKPRTYDWSADADGWTLQATRSNQTGAWYIRPVVIIE